MKKQGWDADFRRRLAEVMDKTRENLASLGLTPLQIERCVEPLVSWREHLEESTRV